MKLRTWFVLSIVLGISAALITGCSKKEENQENKSETKETIIQESKGDQSLSKDQILNEDDGSKKDESIIKDTSKNEDESLKEIDKTDGNLAYPTPTGYRKKRDDVKYGEVITVQYESTTVGKKRDVTIVLPAGYTKDKKYPVLYMCHGLGQDNTQWIKEGHAEITIGNMIASGESKDMILVLPNCRARMNDGGNPPDAFELTNYVAFDNFLNDFQKDLKPFIEKNYSVATGRENTAIVGFSMGGRVALHLGFTLQDTFGYVGAFCPAPGILGYTMMGVTEDGLFKKEDFAIKDEYADDTYVMIVAGKSDNVVGSHPESYHNTLVENKTVHTWFKVTGAHDFTVCNHGLYNFVKNIFGNNK